MTYQERIDNCIDEIRDILRHRLSTSPGITRIAIMWNMKDIPGKTIKEFNNTRKRMFEVFEDFRFKVTGTEEYDFGQKIAIIAERIDPTAPAELVMRGMAEKKFDESLHRSGYRGKK